MAAPRVAVSADRRVESVYDECEDEAIRCALWCQNSWIGSKHSVYEHEVTILLQAWSRASSMCSI